MEGLISHELARVLDARRVELNGLFGEYSRRYPGIVPDEFLLSFAGLAEPALAAIRKHASGGSRTQPLTDDEAGSLVAALYAGLLECGGRGLIGGEKHPLLERALITLLSRFPRALRDDPDGFFRGSVNAIIALEGRGPGSLEKWISTVAATAECDPGYDVFRRIGLIAAWLSGLAQYRTAALGELGGIPRDILARLFNVPGGSADLEGFIPALSADPWLDPARAAHGERTETVYFTTAGGYSGYHSLFRSPPLVALHEDMPVAFAAGNVYDIIADRWGTFFLEQEIDAPDIEAGKKNTRVIIHKNSIVINDTEKSLAGALSLDGHPVPDFSTMPVSSVAVQGNTVFVTSRLSYKIFILGISGG